MSIQVTVAVVIDIFPDSSTYSNTYSPFSVNVCVFPPSTVTFSLSKLIVAITSLFVKFVVLYVIVAFGRFLSMFLTVAVADPVFPAASINSNVNVPFPVNVRVLLPLLFVIVISSLGFTKVAITFPFVLLVVLYSIVAVGAILSIQVTTAFTLPLFPAASAYSNVNVPLSVNKYVVFPLLFVIVTFSLSNVIAASTLSLVGSIVLYTIIGCGICLSIHVTSAFATPVFPVEVVNVNVYSPFSVNVCVFPPATVTFSWSKLIVAITSVFVRFVVLYVIVATGNVLSIHVTFATAVPVFPALSTYSNVYSPFSVNVCVFPSCTVTFSLLKLIVAITSPFVASIMLYEIVGTGAVLSIQSTVAVAVPVFPKSFTNSNVNVPFSVNVYVLFPSLFFIVMLSSELKVAITS